MANHAFTVYAVTRSSQPQVFEKVLRVEGAWNDVSMVAEGVREAVARQHETKAIILEHPVEYKAPFVFVARDNSYPSVLQVGEWKSADFGHGLENVEPPSHSLG